MAGRQVCLRLKMGNSICNLTSHQRERAKFWSYFWLLTEGRINGYFFQLTRSQKNKSKKKSAPSDTNIQFQDPSMKNTHLKNENTNEPCAQYKRFRKKTSANINLLPANHVDDDGVQ